MPTGLRVLFMSGYPDEVFQHHNPSNNGVLLRAKPFAKVRLAQELRSALDGRAQESHHA